MKQKIIELQNSKQFKNGLEQLKQISLKRGFDVCAENKGNQIHIRVFKKLSEEEVQAISARSILHNKP